MVNPGFLIDYNICVHVHTVILNIREMYLGCLFSCLNVYLRVFVSAIPNQRCVGRNALLI